MSSTSASFARAASRSGQALPRPRLVERLLMLPPAGVALLVAPAGYGGRTLLRDTAALCPGTAVWLTRKPFDLGSEGFWTEAHAALGAAGVRVPDLPTGIDDPAVSTRFTFELGQAMSSAAEPLLLLAELGPLPDADRNLQLLIDVLPATARLMVRAHRAPHLDVSTVLAAGRLQLLDQWDLSIEPAEARLYLEACLPHLPPGRRDALVDAAEGWMGALHAAVAGAGGRANPDPLDWLLGHGLDLLFGSLFAALDPADADLLVRTSPLEELTPAACDWVTQRSDSGARLAGLAARLILTTTAGATGVRYRCHGLLRQYLQHQLDARDGQTATQARVAVGQWLAQRGDIDGAINQMLDIGNVDEARALLDSHVGMLLDAGRSKDVQQWYRKLPATSDPGHDELLLGAAWSELLSGDPAAASRHLVELDGIVSSRAFLPEQLKPSAAHMQWLTTEVEYLRASVMMWTGSTDRALELVHQVRAIYGDLWERTAPQSAAMSQVRLNLWHRQDEAARAQLARLLNQPGTNEYYHRVTLPSLRAGLAASDGSAHRAAFLADEALAAMADAGTLGVMDAGDAMLARARALVDLNEAYEAVEVTSEVRRRAAAAGHVVYETLALAHKAVAHASAWDREQADAALDEARLVLSRRGAGASIHGTVDAAEVEVAVLLGDSARARRCLDRLGPGPLHDRLALRVATMRGTVPYGQATQLVRAVRPSVPRDVVDARLLMAATIAQSQNLEAEAHLRAAVEAAHEAGMQRALAGRCEILGSMALRLAQSGQSPAAAALVAAAAEPVREESEPLPPLSPGERDLLHRLAEVGSHRQLADDMGISVNTVKTRLRRLYRKLGVHDRMSALRKVNALP